MGEVLDCLEAAGHNVADFTKWTDADIRRLVSAFLAFRFPTVLALNKVDKAAPGTVPAVTASLPAHGIRTGVGVCARSECEAVKAALTGGEGEGAGDGAVWSTLGEALGLSGRVFVFPVSDLSTCEPIPAMARAAAGSTGATKLGENQVRRVRGGEEWILRCSCRP